MERAWTTVTRHRRPSHFLTSPYPPPTKANVLRPSSSTTYAQALQVNPYQSPKPTQQTTQQSSPRTPTQETNKVVYISSPHSPTKLRYPTSPHYQEWWGRCFRCARKGHVVAECKYPKMCLICGKEGHSTGECKHVRLTPKHTPSQLSTPAGVSGTKGQRDPGFEEFLRDPEPTEEPLMPPNKPKRVQCYFNQDG